MPRKGMFCKFIRVLSAGALAFALAPVFPAQTEAQTAEDGAGTVTSPAGTQENFVYHPLEGGDASQPLAAVATDDPDSAEGKQYFLDDWTGGGVTGGEKSGAGVRRAWSLSKSAERAGGDAAVTIAELDTGVDVAHEDLAANIDTEHMGTVVAQGDGGFAVKPGTCEDIYGHGTHVAGVLAAATDNGTGVAGVSYNARLLPVNVCYLDKDGTCTTDTRRLLAGFSYLEGLMKSGVLTNLRVVNISLGGDAGASGAQDYALEQAIRTFRDEYNVLTVCAGGNGDEDGEPVTDRTFPSDFDESFSVSWLGADGRAAKSADYNECKDISAPGTDVYSTMSPALSWKNKEHRSYGFASGSSLAAPVVSGIAALLWAKYPDLTTDEVRRALQQTAHAIPGAPEELGSAGAADAAAALEYAGSRFCAAGKKRISRAAVFSDAFSDRGDWHLPWTGRALAPRFSLSLDGETLKEGVDYTVSYADNVDGGTATAVFSGIGAYQGVRTARFDIVDDIGSCTVSGIPAQVRTGSAVVPTLEVLDSDGDELEEGADYLVSVSNNVDIGQATVTLRGVHGYRGSLTAKFWIVAKSSKASTKKVVLNVEDVTEKALAGVVKSNTTTVALGSKTKKISAGAFAKFPKVTNLVLKTRKLTKETARDALKGARVKTVQVSLGSRKLNQKYMKRYRSYLA